MNKGMPLVERTNVLLTELHTLAFPVRAARLLVLHDQQQLSALHKLLLETEHKKLQLLGAGSNTFFSGNYNGLLLHVQLKGKKLLATSKDHRYAYVEAAAGENWHDFVCWTLAEGYGGLENLAFIPGSVGAAPVQNIGAYGCSLSHYFHELTAYDLSEDKWARFKATDCCFGYRDSLFKQTPKKPWLICSLTLRLPILKPTGGMASAWVPCLNYEGVCETLAEQGASVTQARAEQIAKAVISLRQRKLPDPADCPNAGSFFKNPIVTKKQFEQLKGETPALKGHTDGMQVKLSAAQLIEHCGWKGRRMGKVGVSDKHALVLTHDGGGQAEAMVALIESIQASVWKRFGLALEPEVRIIS